MNKGNHIEVMLSMPTALKGKPADADQLYKQLKSAGIECDIEMLPTPGSGPLKGKAAAPNGNLLVKTKIREGELSAWDASHVVQGQVKAQVYAEPDIWQSYQFDGSKQQSLKSFGSNTPPACNQQNDFDPDWMPHQNKVWHLDDAFSQLASARNMVMQLNNDIIRIGHIDTGYDPDNHATRPPNLNLKLQRNFVDDESNADASDRNSGGLANQPRHGTGTMGILAGNKVNLPMASFNDFLGGAPFADIVPLRISKTVILFKTSAFYKALQYLTNMHLNGTPVHVVSMSMGGLASQMWADAVNAAYEAGIFITTAAGNNFGGITPTHLVYPARFGRVVAACGATYDFAPYRLKQNKLNEMQGNYGPRKLMGTALAAFTPNTPWARMGCKNTVSFDGAGTSSATPQIAAAAAIYWKKYKKELDRLPWGYLRVEAVRNALFRSALGKLQKGWDGDVLDYFGKGIVQAKNALDVPVAANMPITPADSVSFPLLNVLFKAGPPVAGMDQSRKKMIEVELAQLVQQHIYLQELLKDETKSFYQISKTARKAFIGYVLSLPQASEILKKYLKEQYTLLVK